MKLHISYVVCPGDIWLHNNKNEFVGNVKNLTHGLGDCDSMLVLIEYPTHHYMRRFDKTKKHCPECGEKGIWREAGSEDYYAGASYYCASCDSTSHLDSCATPSSRDKTYSKIFQQLETGITFTATTPRGN